MGILIGVQLPPDWPLGFFLLLTFIALVVPTNKDKASVVADITAALA